MSRTTDRRPTDEPRPRPSGLRLHCQAGAAGGVRAAWAAAAS